MAAALLVVLAGCNLPTVQETALAPEETQPAPEESAEAPVVETEEPAAEQPEVEEPTEPETPETEPASVPEVTPVEPSTGPWLVLNTAPNGTGEGSLWVVNPDGSGLRQVFASPYALSPHESSAAVAPSGGYVAFISQSDGNLHNLTLNLLTLPDGLVQVITPLTTLETEPAPEALGGDPALEAARAVFEATSLAWSPDGRKLAFMGMMQGPTSDLYVYSLDDDTTIRLTDGPAQAYGPEWSPDSRSIVHFGVSSFGTGAGYNMEGVWAAAADGSAVVTLYDPSGSGAEEFIGWVAPDTFIVNSWDAGCGRRDLRAVNAETGETLNTLWKGAFSEVAFTNRGELLLALPGDITGQAGCGVAGMEPGLYLIQSWEGAAKRAYEGAPFWSRPTWSAEMEVFFAQTEGGAVQVAPDGQVTELPAPGPMTPVVSTDGQWWAWNGWGWSSTPTGMWIGAVGESPTQVFEGAVPTTTWAPDRPVLFFLSEDRLYMANRDGEAFTVREIGQVGAASHTVYLAWVQP